MNVTSAGIGSGLDLEGIIEAYINAEAVPKEVRLQEKEDRLNLELSGVSQFKSVLSSFESVVKTVSELEDFNQQKIDVSTTDISVTTNGYASNGTFEIEVQALAKGSRIQSQSFTDSSQNVGSGTLTFGAGSDSFDVTVDASDTLSTLRDKINEASDNFGVTANVVTTDAGSYLVYSSEVTGAANSLSVTGSDASLDNISTNATVEQAAQDAVITIDGNTVSSDTNEFKNNIEDVTINVSKENIGEPTTLTISQDKENGEKIIRNFVNTYNSMIDTLDTLGNPETGALAFDPNIRQLKSQLTNIVTGSITSGTGGIDSLDDIGITLNKYGKLEISSVGIGTLDSGAEKLSNALENDLNDIGELFASSDGVATQLTTLIESYNGTDGTLTERKSLLSAQIKDIPNEWEALETRLRDYEDTLRSKFTFLDSTVSYYNATSDWLTSALKLPTSSSN